MDIAKIRKKAREREEPGKAAGGDLQPEPSPVGPPGKGAVREAVPAAEEFEDTLTAPSSEAEEGAAPPAPPVGKEGERGFSGEKEAAGPGEVLELLTFSIANEEFAFRVPEVEEIIRYQRITKVPTMPEYVLGITSLRGKIIPVLDLRKRLGLKTSVTEKTKPADGKILILAGPRGMIGASIQKVLGVLRFEEGMVLDPPGHLSEDELRFLEGVVIMEKRFISIIRSYDALDIELT